MSAKDMIGGVLLGALLGAGGVYGVQSLVLDDPGPCGGVCGEGTACEAGRCEPVVAEDESSATEDSDQDGDNKRKRKRRRRGKRGAASEGEANSGLGPALDNDSHVPRFNPNSDQSIGMSDGSGHLSDAQVDRELAKLDKDFQACVSDGAARVDELGTGRVKLGFGVDGKGKVTGVNVSAPTGLTDAGIVPCVRKAIYGHKFPAFDGPVMKVSSSFSVD